MPYLRGFFSTRCTAPGSCTALWWHIDRAIERGADQSHLDNEAEQLALQKLGRIATQFTATDGPLRHGGRSWIARACTVQSDHDSGVYKARH